MEKRLRFQKWQAIDSVTDENIWLMKFCVKCLSWNLETVRERTDLGSHELSTHSWQAFRLLLWPAAGGRLTILF